MLAALAAALVRDLATGAFVADQRNAVLIGGTGTGKSHLAIAIARALIRSGARGRFFNVVDLVNRLETEHRARKQGRIADYLPGSTSSCSTNLAAFPSPGPAVNSSST
jgi:DNA replication protein DnaC